MKRLHGDRARPRVIADGVDKSSSIGTALRELCPTVLFTDRSASLDSKVDLAEFDAVVATTKTRQFPTHMFIFQVGGPIHAHTMQIADTTQTCSIIQDYGTSVNLVTDDQGLTRATASLADKSLAPWLLEQIPRICLMQHTVTDHDGRQTGALELPGDFFKALVRQVDSKPCAGFWKRDPTSSTDGSGAEHWWLPADCPEQASWFEAALQSWALADPHRFPFSQDWRIKKEWMVTEEIAPNERLTALRAELEAMTLDLSTQIEQAESELESARATGDRGARRLLLEQGDQLKQAVLECLRSFDLEAIDSDEQRDSSEDRALEDIEVRCNGDLIVLCEVRGYESSGGKTRDFQRIDRFVQAYERETGKKVDRRWYILNHQFEKSPDERGKPLAGAEEDVEEFAQVGGCVIDSRSLFKLQIAVERGEVSKSAVREALLGATDIFDPTELLQTAQKSASQ